MQPSTSTLALAALAVTVAAAAPVAGTAAAAGESPAFENGIVQVPGGETAEVQVSVPEANGTVRVTIGSEATNFVAHATLVDADGDGNVTVAVDTGAAGTTDAASYLNVSDGDELTGATQETDRLSSPIAPAEYDLRLGPSDDPADEAALVVESASTPSETNASESATLDEAVVTAASGETAAIPLAFADGTESARVTVGSEATNFVVRATVVDADGDGDATLELDTGTAGTTDAASYLRVSDGDELRNATQATDRLSSPLDAGEYDLRVGPAGDASDVGTLVLESASTPETDDGAETTDGATTTDAPATPTLEATATPGDTQTASPGFGVLAGVLALLAVAGLARRR
jgi:PGF-CTERM protein